MILVDSEQKVLKKIRWSRPFPLAQKFRIVAPIRGLACLMFLKYL